MALFAKEDLYLCICATFQLTINLPCQWFRVSADNGTVIVEAVVVMPRIGEGAIQFGFEQLFFK